MILYVFTQWHCKKVVAFHLCKTFVCMTFIFFDYKGPLLCCFRIWFVLLTRSSTPPFIESVDCGTLCLPLKIQSLHLYWSENPLLTILFNDLLHGIILKWVSVITCVCLIVMKWITLSLPPFFSKGEIFTQSSWLSGYLHTYSLFAWSFLSFGRFIFLAIWVEGHCTWPYMSIFCYLPMIFTYIMGPLVLFSLY